MSDPHAPRPPSVDALARSLAQTGLPHPILVEIARVAIADERTSTDADPADLVDRINARAARDAHTFERTLLTPVINGTGVLLHTNLGRAALAPRRRESPAVRARTVEFDLATGERGSRQRSVGQLFATLCGAQDAIVVNNNAAAVLLVLAALAAHRDVAVSRGEAVEIGGSFRVPEVMEQSGARLVDVGTTNRTRLADYTRAVVRPGNDVAVILKVHPSNYTVEGFVEAASVAELSTITTEHGIPVVADIGSGLLDATTPWLAAPTPSWLTSEPAAAQTLAEGAGLVTFSADKLFGGPQAGIIAGRADLVAECAKHPLARALRCGGLVLDSLQQTALAYLHRTAGDDIPFWRMASVPVDALRTRAASIVEQCGEGEVVETIALPGAGSAPGVGIPSAGVAVRGNRLTALRAHDPPVIARTRDDVTVIDLRAVDPLDDQLVAAAINSKS
jgi:L-seryl-tRNA(Ser) seleniumtransferase